MNTYPQYYKAGCKCIKRISDTQGSLVQIPDACLIHTIEYTSLIADNKGNFDRMVISMETVSEETFSKYVSIFYQIKRRQKSVYRETLHTDKTENKHLQKEQVNYF